MKLSKVFLLFFVTSLSLEAYGKRSRSSKVTCPATVSPPMFFSGFNQCINSASKSDQTHNPELRMNAVQSEILYYRGYTVREYETVSEDGYILLTIRVFGGGNSPPRQGKPPILLHHGISTSAGSWIIQPGKRNVVAMLIDAGYDVWLLNARGTIPSRKHTRLNYHTDLKYWEFSLDEMGTKDLPPIFNLIRRATGFSKTFFMCFSLGCGNYFVGLSERLELNDNIEAAILMAPVGYVGHAGSALRLASTVLSIPGVYEAAYLLLRGKFDVDSRDFIRILGFPPELFCNLPFLRCSVCNNILFFVFGGDSDQMDYANLPFAYAHFHDVIPLRVLKHFSQNMQNCSYVRKYDLGRELNLQRYGSSEPPEYEPGRITATTYIFYGESDNVTPAADLFRTTKKMSPNALKLVQKVDWPKFNHLDFVMAKDADKLVYTHALEILAKHRLKRDNYMYQRDSYMY